MILSANPKLTSAEVRDILESTSDKIGGANEYDSNGYSLRFGYGRVNAEKAVAEALRRKNPFIDLPVEDPDASVGLFRFTAQTQKSSGYGVQVGVFHEYGNVLVRTEKYQRIFGKPVIVHITKFKGKVAYRMILGEFRLKSKASAFQKQVKKKGFDSFVVKLSKFK